MKTKKIVLTIFFIVPVLLAGCNKESLEPVTELPVDGTQKVIKVEKNGIGVEFCLVNEQGVPATVFKEGENFRFRLIIKNNISTFDSLYVPLGDGYIPDDFYVMTEEGDTLGRPYYFKGAVYSASYCPMIKKGEQFVLEVPWRGNPDIWQFCTLFAHGIPNPPLKKGLYYTSFKKKFCLKNFSHGNSYGELVCTNILNFKIHFEIK